MRIVLAAVLCCLLAAAEAMGADARLVLRSDPAGLDAWAGDLYLGRTPVVKDLPGGPVRLILAHPSDSLYRPPAADTTIVLAAGETMEVALSVGRMVAVRSVPHGLPVLRGDRRIGETPLQWMMQPQEAVGLRLETPLGAVPIPAESLLQAGSWEWRMGGEILRRSSVQSAGGLKRIGRIAMPGVAVVLAAAGILAERSADSAYERYRQTADPAAIRKHYDDAVARDRWAAALWIGAEASIAAAVAAWLFPDGDEAGDEGEAP